MCQITILTFRESAAPLRSNQKNLTASLPSGARTLPPKVGCSNPRKNCKTLLRHHSTWPAHTRSGPSERPDIGEYTSTDQFRWFERAARSGVQFDRSSLWRDFARTRLKMIGRTPSVSAGQLKCAIFQSLRMEVPTLPLTAARLGLSARSLQRQLEMNKVTYSDVVDQVRFELARSLLSSTNFVVADIGATLRYRDPSSFSRAFARWSGMSPREYRTRYSAMTAPPIASDRFPSRTPAE